MFLGKMWRCCPPVPVPVPVPPVCAPSGCTEPLALLASTLPVGATCGVGVFALVTAGPAVSVVAQSMFRCSHAFCTSRWAADTSVLASCRWHWDTKHRTWKKGARDTASTHSTPYTLHGGMIQVKVFPRRTRCFRLRTTVSCAGPPPLPPSLLPPCVIGAWPPLLPPCAYVCDIVFFCFPFRRETTRTRTPMSSCSQSRLGFLAGAATTVAARVVHRWCVSAGSSDALVARRKSTRWPAVGRSRRSAAQACRSLRER